MNRHLILADKNRWDRSLITRHEIWASKRQAAKQFQMFIVIRCHCLRAFNGAEKKREKKWYVYDADDCITIAINSHSECNLIAYIEYIYWKCKQKLHTLINLIFNKSASLIAVSIFHNSSETFRSFCCVVYTIHLIQNY